MYRVRRYSELAEPERARLFAFTARHDPERFADQQAMERGYGSSAFEHGETQLSLWAGQEVLGAMAAVVRETALRGETFITAVAIEPEHAAGFAPLLQRALALMPDQPGLVVRMGISPRHAHVEALAGRHRFAPDYDGLIMSFTPTAPTATDFRVEVVSAENREHYRRVLDEAFRGSPNGATVDMAQIEELMAEIRFADLLGLGFDGDTPVAAYELDVQDEVGWLEALAVDPARQGRGYGKRMLEAAIARLQSHGATTIKLLVMSANGPAVKLYERHGFTLEKVTARWWRLAT